MNKSENKLEVLIEGCASRSCPTIYKDSNGKIFVQGYKLDNTLRNQANIGENEDIVELSPELFEALKNMK